MANEDLGPALFKKGCFYLVCLHAGMGEPQGLPSTRFHPKLKGGYVIPPYPFSGVSSFPTIRWFTIGEITENIQVILTYFILVAGIDGKRRRYWDVV